MSGDVAIVSVFGVLSQRPSLMTSGGTSAEEIGRAVDAAVADRAVKSIVLNADSPGGSVFGIPEAADKILAARQQKRVIGLANATAASAAYWLLSQCSEIVVTPSGRVGSIGVIAAHVDETGAEEKAGIKTTIISAGQYKAEGFKPITDESRAALQREVDSYYRDFLNAVARGRRVPVATVESNYGQGRMKLARDAVATGMADRTGTLEDVLRSAQTGGSYPATFAGNDDAKARRHRVVQMATLGLPLPKVKF